VLATRVGYAGGAAAAPTYHDLGDDSEAVEVTFDPLRLDYEALLDYFWTAFPHSLPAGPVRTRMAVFPIDADQASRATASRERFERRAGERITTAVVAGARFVAAEEKLQKFHLQRRFPALVERLGARYGSRAAALASPAALHLNAWATGLAPRAVTPELLAEIGLDRAELDRLTKNGTAPPPGLACPTPGGG
jgi:peptide-methionine (S)-S-oxide reductase